MLPGRGQGLNKGATPRALGGQNLIVRSEARISSSSLSLGDVNQKQWFRGGVNQFVPDKCEVD
jgi:hypothetical protein